MFIYLIHFFIKMQYLVVKMNDTGQNPIFKNIFEDKQYIKEENRP